MVENSKSWIYTLSFNKYFIIDMPQPVKSVSLSDSERKYSNNWILNRLKEFYLGHR